MPVDYDILEPEAASGVDYDVIEPERSESLTPVLGEAALDKYRYKAPNVQWDGHEATAEEAGTAIQLRNTNPFAYAWGALSPSERKEAEEQSKEEFHKASIPALNEPWERGSLGMVAKWLNNSPSETAKKYRALTGGGINPESPLLKAADGWIETSRSLAAFGTSPAGGATIVANTVPIVREGLALYYAKEMAQGAGSALGEFSVTKDPYMGVIGAGQTTMGGLLGYQVGRGGFKTVQTLRGKPEVAQEVAAQEPDPVTAQLTKETTAASVESILEEAPPTWAEIEKAAAKASYTAEKARPATEEAPPLPAQPEAPSPSSMPPVPFVASPGMSQLEANRRNSELLGNLVLERRDVPASLVKAVRGVDESPSLEGFGWDRVGDVWRYSGVMGPPKISSPVAGTPTIAAESTGQAAPTRAEPASAEALSKTATTGGDALTERGVPNADQITRPSEVAPVGEAGPVSQVAGRVSGEPEAVAKAREAQKVEEVTERGQVQEKGKEVAQPAEVTKADEIIGMGGARPSEFDVKASPTAVKNRVMDAERVARGLPPMEDAIPRHWRETVWPEAMRKIDEDPTLPERLEDAMLGSKHVPTDVEHTILLRRRAEVKFEMEKAQREAAQAFDDVEAAKARGDQAAVEARQQALSDATDQANYWSGKLELNEKVMGKGGAGTEAGRSLAARKMMTDEDMNLASLELQKRADNGYRQLTPSERSKLVKIADKYKKVSEELQKKLDELETKRSGEPVDAAISRVKRDIAGKRNPGKPGTVQALVRKLVEENPKITRDELVDRVHEVLKKDRPDITRQQVADEISGYGDYKPLRKDDISNIVRDLKGQIQQIRKLEDMAGGVAPKKTGVERRIPSDEERRLIKQVEEAKRKGGYKITDPATQLRTSLQAIKTRLENQITDLTEQISKREKIVPKKTKIEYDAEANALRARRDELKAQYDEIFPKEPISDAQRLANWKKRTTDRIAEFEDRIKNKDYSSPVRRPPVELDAEAIDLFAKQAEVKRQWMQDRYNDRLAQQTPAQKVGRYFGEGLNTIRAILTGLEFSAVLRQGAFIVRGHPVVGAKAMPDMFKAFWSKEGQARSEQQILHRDNYPKYKRSGLYLSEHGLELSKSEEVFATNLLEKANERVGEVAEKAGAAKPLVQAASIPLKALAGSQRAYTTFLNRLRADAWDAMAKTWSKNGELTLTEEKIISNLINKGTGRGSFGKSDFQATILNVPFFAPRYVASRFQLMAGQPFYGGTARTRMLVAREYARFFAGTAVFYAFYYAALKGLTGKAPDIETDPRSSDLLKLKVGNTRIDPMAGMIQNAVLAARLATGETKQLRTGNIVALSGPNLKYGGMNKWDVMTQFLRQKLSPAFSSGVDIATGKDLAGEEVTPWSIAKRNLIPITYQDVAQIMREEGIPPGLVIMLLSMFGEGVQNFDVNKKPAK